GPMNPRRMLVATDFSEPSRRALALAQSLASPLSSELHVVHVHSIGEVPPRMPEDSLWGSAERFDAHEAGLRMLLERWVTEVLGGKDKAVLHVVHGRPSEAILDVAKTVHADLVCVGATGKTAPERWL